MSGITVIWERIEAWYGAQGASHLLNPAATPQAIADAEKALAVTFPAELKESLLRHNGTLEGNWPRGELLSTERIVRESQSWANIFSDEGFRKSIDFWSLNEDSGSIKPGWWNDGWIFLDADGGGNGAALDTVPAEYGKVGQILDMDHETGPNGPIYDSLTEYLAAVAKSLESGEYSYFKNSEYDDEGICYTDELEEYMDLEDEDE